MPTGAVGSLLCGMKSLCSVLMIGEPFKLLVLPFGWNFESSCVPVLQGLVNECNDSGEVLVSEYLDDILLMHEDGQLLSVFVHIEGMGFVLNCRKCIFSPVEVLWLGKWMKSVDGRVEWGLIMTRLLMCQCLVLWLALPGGGKQSGVSWVSCAG